MLQFVCVNLGGVLVTIGLLCDIGGALLIAWEAFRKYEGDRFQSAASVGMRGESLVTQSDVQPTLGFAKWEAKREKLMKIGIGVLCFGFFLQLVGQWL